MYYDEIDPTGEDRDEKECAHCGNPQIALIVQQLAKTTI